MSGNYNTNCEVAFPLVMNSKLGGYFTDAKVPLHQAGFLKDLKQNVLLQLVVYFIIHRAVSGLLLILSLCGYSQKYQEMY